MHVTQIQALSPLDGRYRERLTFLNQIFSEYALIKYRVTVEIEYLIFFLQKTQLQPLTDEEIKTLKSIYLSFDETAANKIKELEDTCHHDVKAVEYYLQERLSAASLTSLIPYIHFGLTSEDINSCAYGLALEEARIIVIIPELTTLIETLLDLSEKTADTVMLARTHGQPAVPTTMGKEMLVFAARLEKTLITLKNIQIEAKLSGAVGNWNAVQFVLPDQDWRQFSEEFITSLGLRSNSIATQIISAESYSEFFQILVRTNAILIDCARDCWQYISDNYLIQQVKEQHVGSSTMPHKVNPIDFENSEGNAGVAIALLKHFIEKLPISRLQRDLSDSTVKRSFGTAFGHTVLALKSLNKGLEKVSPNTDLMKEVVNSHPEVLAEALQTALRLSGEADAYDIIKKKTRGTQVTKQDLDDAAQHITDQNLQQRFNDLTPAEYTGLASTLVTKEIVKIRKGLHEKK